MRFPVSAAAAAIGAPEMKNHEIPATFRRAGSLISASLIIAVCMAFLPVAPAGAQGALRGYTCAQVREAVVKYGGPENAEALARGQGGTDQEIAAAKRCLIQPVHFRRSVRTHKG